MISDTRFMSEDGLSAFVKSLVRSAEATLPARTSCPTTTAPCADISGSIDVGIKTRDFMDRISTAVEGVASGPKAVSRASVAWFEMLLVEVSLRNRDRFGVIWPILAEHYRTAVGGPDFSLDYVAER